MRKSIQVNVYEGLVILCSLIDAVHASVVLINVLTLALSSKHKKVQKTNIFL